MLEFATQINSKNSYYVLSTHTVAGVFCAFITTSNTPHNTFSPFYRQRLSKIPEDSGSE